MRERPHPAGLLQTWFDDPFVGSLTLRPISAAFSGAGWVPSLLRGHRDRPRNRSAAEQRYELAAFHSITSSARPRSGNGIVRPSVLAVLRLMISSTFVDCTTGRSSGFSPLRIRPV